MKEFINFYIQFDGFAFLIIGIVVLLKPSPQPGLTKPVNEVDLLPFSQTRQLLASMFIASALLLIVIGKHFTDLQILKEVSIVRVISFALVISINAFQYKSKRWKSTPLVVLMTLFSLMSLIYLYFIFNN